jgi:hypothetical protein
MNVSAENFNNVLLFSKTVITTAGSLFLVAGLFIMIH